MYPIIHVPDNAFDLPEQLGTKPKFWFEGENGHPMMFKEGRANTGENWAEKACCEIARALQLPHAEYDFAVWRGRKGVVSPSFVPPGGRLVLGNEVMARVIRGYEGEKRYSARQHTVRAVMTILRSERWMVPLGYAAPAVVQRAADVFAGYLMLDALVSNQDRHHQNWGFILTAEQKVAFTPTFDHASSLGRNESDEARTKRMTTSDRGSSLEAYVNRSKSAFFGSESTKPLSTIAAFQEAAKITPTASEYWLKMLGKVPTMCYEEIFAAIPETEISRPGIEFALGVLSINRKRLLKIGAV